MSMVAERLAVLSFGQGCEVARAGQDPVPTLRGSDKNTWELCLGFVFRGPGFELRFFRSGFHRSL